MDISGKKKLFKNITFTTFGFQFFHGLMLQSHTTSFEIQRFLRLPPPHYHHNFMSNHKNKIS